MQREKRKARNNQERDMPYYVWVDKNTGKRVEIQRRLKEIEIAPDKDECLDQDISIEEYAEADWERGLAPTPHVGEKGKGNWGR